MKIALDAMGGDFAPERPVAAAVEALAHFPQIEKLLLFGKEPEIRAELKKFGSRGEDARLEILPPSQARRPVQVYRHAAGLVGQVEARPRQLTSQCDRQEPSLW